MVISQNYHDFRLRGKAKGAEIILRERGLWPLGVWRSDGMRLLLRCPTENGRSGYTPYRETELENKCCARSILAHQKDFRTQKGRLQEELESAHQEVIFYPKFHCELNFIEHFWCSAKWYTRENCEYSLKGLRRVLPEALDSVTPATINCYYRRCMRTLGAYMDGHKEKVYTGHRQVADKKNGS